MAINFPISPTINDVYTYNGNSWKWDGTSWISTPPILDNTIDVNVTSPIAGNVLKYNGSSWINSEDLTGDAVPKMTNIEVTDSDYVVLDDTAVNIDGGYVKITGTGFSSGCQVIINNTNASSVTYISSTEVRAQLPAMSAGTYHVYLVNSDGGVAIRFNGVSFSGLPTWETNSSLPGTDSGSPISIQLSATGATSYQLQSGSSLPDGLTLSSSGLLSGTITIEDETTYNFTVVAIDAENQDSPRSFSFTITSGDEYFPNTVLLLSGNGTGVTPFNADASTNNFEIAINGDTKPNRFNPHQEGYYGNYFDGSGDYLSPPSNAAFAFGTEAYTVEAWVYRTATDSDTSILFSAASATGAFNFGINPNGALILSNYGTGPVVTGNAGDVPLDSWCHIVAVRSSTSANDTKLYANGVLKVTGTDANNWTVSSSPIIGGFTTVSNYDFIGYISNLRIVKGTAVYTSNFTPPIAPLTAIAGTVLLTCQSNRFKDNSTNAFAITRTGDVAVTYFQPFTLPSSVEDYGAGYFDGTGDYLSIPSNAAFIFGTGDFTIEFWSNLSATGVDDGIFYEARSSGTTSTGFVLNSRGVAGGYRVNFYTGGAANLTPNSVPYNSWNHIALTRSSGTVRIFLNGVIDLTATYNNNFTDNPGVTIGQSLLYANSNITGYLSNFRVVKGTAVYTSNFTPPTAPLTPVANTSLLTLQTNGGANDNGFIDSSPNNFLITRNGNTTQGSFSPYGANWSNYFGGVSGNYLATTSAESSVNFGTSDFTVEFWLNANSTAGNNFIIDARSSGSQNNLCILISDGYWLWQYAGSNIIYTNSNMITVGTWNHVVFVRSSGTLSLYVNGVFVTSATDSTNYASAAAAGRPGIGGGGYNTSMIFNGAISNLRIVKGTAIYTNAFTPATAPLTAVTGTSLLTCQSNRFKDSSANNYTVTPNGSVSVQRFSPFAPTAAYDASVIGGSGYFDGTGDYLSSSSTGIDNFGTGDFTVEAWIYVTTTGTNNPIVVDQTTGQFAFGIAPTNYLYYGTSDTADILTSSTISDLKSCWHHVAISRTSGTASLYLDGVRVATGANSTNFTSGGLWAGRRASGAAFNGYISDVRVVKGSGVYSGASITVPTAPLTAVTNTQLLLNMTNAGIYDNAMMNDLETVGNAQVSTTQKKFGTGSMYFDGTGDCLVSQSNSLSLSTGDFTVEFWIYFNAVNNATVKFIYDFRTASATSASFFAQESDNSWTYWNGAGSAVSTGLTSTTFATGQWYHLAITRSSNVLYCFVNGTKVSSNPTDSSNYASTTLTVGARYTQDFAFAGYIDDLRITKGYARYTSNFTPPTTAHNRK